MIDPLRSFLRTREAWFRKHPIDDAHVRLYKKLRKKLHNQAKRKQAMWSCPRCGASVKQIDRHRDRDGRLSAHCGCRAMVTLAMTPDELRLHKRQIAINLKRKYRRMAGARLRSEIAAEAKAKREAELAIREKHDSHVKALRELQAALHDAHCRRYANVLLDRAKYAKRYEANPQAERRRASQRKQLLPDAYVLQQLKSFGIPREIVTPELIELKRESMQYRRLSRNMKSTLKNHLKEQNETITKHP